MSAVLRPLPMGEGGGGSSPRHAEEPTAKYLTQLEPAIVRDFNLLATSPGGVARLRELILTLAVQGKLVPQDPSDKPASVLLQKIRMEKERLVQEGQIRGRNWKDSNWDFDLPFSLPPSWEWSSLAEVGLINPRNNAADDLPASFVEMRSIPAPFSEPHTTELRKWGDIKSGFTHFAEGDIGVAKITPCFENGKSTVFQNLNNGIGAGTTELHVVRPLGGMTPRYVLLFLKSPEFLLDGEVGMTGSAGQKRLPRSYLEHRPFPLPPLAEQSRIVARVEELMRLCDALEAKGKLEAAQHAELLNILLGTLTNSETPEALAENWQRVAAHFELLLDRPEAVDTLEQTILQLAVRGLLVPQDPTDEPASAPLRKIGAKKDRLIVEERIKRGKPLRPVARDDHPFALPRRWAWVRLEDISEAVVDCPHSTPHFVSSGLLCLDTNSFKNGELLPHKLRYVDQATFTERTARLRPQPGDLVFAREGSVGESVIIPAGAIACLGQRVMLFRFSERASNEFVRLAITSRWFLDKVLALHKGIGAKHVNVGDMRAAVIPLPPVAEQLRIVARVESLRRLGADLRGRLSASQATQAHLADALVASATA